MNSYKKFTPAILAIPASRNEGIARIARIAATPATELRTTTGSSRADVQLESLYLALKGHVEISPAEWFIVPNRITYQAEESKIYAHYCGWCAQNNRAPMSRETLRLKIKELFPHAKYYGPPTHPAPAIWSGFRFEREESSHYRRSVVAHYKKAGPRAKRK